MISYNNDEIEQGTIAWLDLRKKHITATDAAVIIGASPYKSKLQLYNEKMSPEHKTFKNAAMQRGIDLEPIARDLFNLKIGITTYPKVIVSDWAMASLDGISDDGKIIVEIKCPGDKDHRIALTGKVPDHYYPQLQHQMWVCNVEKMYYFSFDGADGITIEVEKDHEYLENLIAEEFKFYMCMKEGIPPESNNYTLRSDEAWKECASEWKSLMESQQALSAKEESLKKKLIFLSGESNTKGAGITLSQVSRKGNIDYAKIPQLKGIDLEIYRKEAINSWRVSWTP